MPNSEETLMWIGGEPKKKEDESQEKTEAKAVSQEDNRPEWKKKWDKVVSGEATIEELGDKFTKGDIEALRTKKIGKAVGFSDKADHMRILVVHVGYSKEEIESKPFQDYMKRTKAETENLFGKKNIEMGFHIPDKETPTITSYGFSHMIIVDNEESVVLKRRLEKTAGAIDIVNFRINPEAVNSEYFGMARERCITPGPSKNKNGEYKVAYKSIAEHEMMHCISNHGMKHNPTYFGDGYFRNLYPYEARFILSGNHLEFIAVEENGKPVKGGSKVMEKVLKKAEIEDQNVYMADHDGNKYKVLLVNPGKNIMRGSFSNDQRAEAIKNNTYITPAQKVAINEVIKEYLAGEKRLETSRKAEKPKTKIKGTANKKTKEKDNSYLKSIRRSRNVRA